MSNFRILTVVAGALILSVAFLGVVHVLRADSRQDGRDTSETSDGQEVTAAELPASAPVLSSPAGQKHKPESRGVDLDALYKQLAAGRARVLEEAEAKGLVQSPGGFSPPLPPGVVMKADGVPPLLTTADPEPIHRGNYITYRQEVDKRSVQLEQALMSSKAPAQRMQYFDEFLKHPKFNFRLDGWHLEVNDLSTTEEAVPVKIHSCPIVSTPLVPYMNVSGALIETYELRGGELILIKTEPFGDAPIQFISW